MDQEETAGAFTVMAGFVGRRDPRHRRAAATDLGPGRAQEGHLRRAARRRGRAGRVTVCPGLPDRPGRGRALRPAAGHLPGRRLGAADRHHPEGLGRSLHGHLQRRDGVGRRARAGHRRAAHGRRRRRRWAAGHAVARRRPVRHRRARCSCPSTNAAARTIPCPSRPIRWRSLPRPEALTVRRIAAGVSVRCRAAPHPVRRVSDFSAPWPG